MESKSVIKARAEGRIHPTASVGARASVGEGASVKREGGYLGGVARHPFDAYTVEGVPILRYGCEVLPLVDWTAERQLQLCEVHDRGATADLARIVRTVRAYFGV